MLICPIFETEIVFVSPLAVLRTTISTLESELEHAPSTHMNASGFGRKKVISAKPEFTQLFPSGHI